MECEMAEKSVVRRPKDIDAVINRGGSSAASQEDTQEQERVFNLRVPESLVTAVDALRKQRTGKISRNTWILEAIEDKIQRES
jgi:predicted HicB family RNase H-like nuclease